MSFRARLSLFFLLIVIVPMVSVAVVVFRLIDDNEAGKADARVAAGQRAAIGEYDRARRGAGESAEALGRDRRLSLALRRDDRTTLRVRVRVLRRVARAAYVEVDPVRGEPIAIGPADAVATASRRLVTANGRPAGTATVATMDAAELARRIRELTDFDVVVARDGRVLAATDRGLAEGPLPRRGPLERDGEELRVASFEAQEAGGRRLRVTVLAGPGAGAGDVAESRLIAIGLLTGFLVLAFAFAAAVSRSLQAQIARFLEAARRLGSGDFSTAIPIEGRDEFAALGEEFNSMSAQLEEKVRELERERQRLEEAIRRIGDTVASNLDRDALLEIVVASAVQGVGGDCGRATARDTPEQPLTERSHVGELPRHAAAIQEAEAAALRTRRPARHQRDGSSALAFPLGDPDGAPKAAGVISVAREKPFSARDEELFGHLARQAAVSLENVELHELVQRQAVTDELTGLANHRRFQEALADEAERSRRFGAPVALVMVDIDRFKRVNDTYGHQQGDVVLREVARVLRETSREIDLAARYGGEELALVLPGTDVEGAAERAERLRQAIADLRVPRVEGDGEPLTVTASLGVAAMPEIAEEEAALIAAADAALYRAKDGGRDRVELAAPAAVRAAGDG